MLLIAKMSQDPVDDLLVLNRGNDSDSTPATIAGTIGKLLHSQREWPLRAFYGNAFPPGH